MSVHPSAPAAVDYAGVRHARLTRSMRDVGARSRALASILTELRYQIPDGQSKPLSNRVIAERTGLSEGFVSAAVRWLAGASVSYYPAMRVPPAQPFIERQMGEDGTHRITMLPPPECRPKAPKVAANDPPQATQLELFASGAFVGDHSHDPHGPDAPAAPPSPERALAGDHGHDPPIHREHADQQEQPARIAPDLYETLRRLGAAPGIAREASQALPAGTTPADLQADLAEAARRPGRRGTPLGYCLGAWRGGRRLTPQGAPSDGATTRRPSASNRRRAERPGPRGPAAGSGVDYAAILAAARPLDLDPYADPPVPDLSL